MVEIRRRIEQLAPQATLEENDAATKEINEIIRINGQVAHIYFVLAIAQQINLASDTVNSNNRFVLLARRMQFLLRGDNYSTTISEIFKDGEIAKYHGINNFVGQFAMKLNLNAGEAVKLYMAIMQCGVGEFEREAYTLFMALVPHIMNNASFFPEHLMHQIRVFMSNLQGVTQQPIYIPDPNDLKAIEQDKIQRLYEPMDDKDDIAMVNILLLQQQKKKKLIANYMQKLQKAQEMKYLLDILYKKLAEYLNCFFQIKY
ncbi:MAG: hypothetical protein EZS28_014770 [Streblomastix strix]|uniref:Uncharacterized protein n=1 Tax=Streblomastix strix TaxID=222440 RepID=A0A5J4W4Y6_9EUKA|nr:MAG: hypothetical protein EZS28_014770 [Streblomastix strix]